jgi:hypothetical protein
MTNPIGYYFGGPQQPQPQSQWVTSDYPCRRCGTNLNGQPIAGRCPQCGAPVGVSIYGELLQYAEPGWLGRVRSGLLMTLWTTIIMVAAVIAVVVVGIVIGMQSAMAAQRGGSGRAPGTMPTELEWLAPATAIIALIGAIFAAMGMWQATTPEPGVKEDSISGLRQVLRITLICSIALSVVSVGLMIGKVITEHEAGGLVMAALGAVIHAAVLISLGMYLSAIARRVPDDRMAGRFRASGWTIGIGSVVSSLLQVVVLAMGTNPTAVQKGDPSGMGGLMVLGCVNGLIGLAMLVFLIILLVAMGQLAGKIRVAMEYSRAVWSQPQGTPMPPPAV